MEVVNAAFFHNNKIKHFSLTQDKQAECHKVSKGTFEKPFILAERISINQQ